MIRTTINKIIVIPLSFHASKPFKMMETIAQCSWLSNRLTVWLFPTTFLPQKLLAVSRSFRQLEQSLKPRLFYPDFPAAFQRASGAMVIICGFLLLLPLPIPFSNSFPALTIILLGAAGLERDGASFVSGCIQLTLCLGFFDVLGFGGSEVWQRFLN